MTRVIVLGGRGFVGSRVVQMLAAAGHDVLPVHRDNYAEHAGASADVLVNCNGNSYRYRANQDPDWDYQASVVSVEHSLRDFAVSRVIYVSTVDVYPDRGLRSHTREDQPIDTTRLEPYGFHKWLAERMVEQAPASSTALRLGSVIGPGLRKGPIFDLIEDRPLYLSPESRLTFVDTDTIGNVVLSLLDDGPPLLNLTGRESVVLETVIQEIGRESAPVADATTHRYDIDTARSEALFDLPTSSEVVQQFLERSRSPA